MRWRMHSPHSLGLVKFGLAGCARQSDWQLRWLQAGRRFSPFTALVAVAYADARAASAPAFDEVLRLAATGPAATLLIDTWDKSQGGLLAHWSLAQLQDVIHQARQFGLRTAVAGSLDIAAIEQIVPLKPDFIAVRTAACDGAREGVVSARRVARLSRCIADSARIRPAY